MDLRPCISVVSRTERSARRGRGRTVPAGAVLPALRRKSHIAANMMSGLAGSIFTSVQPVERFVPLRTCCHVLPPSVVLLDHGRANRSTTRRVPRRRPCRCSSDQRPLAQCVPIFPSQRVSTFHRHRLTYRFRRQWKRCCASTIHGSGPDSFEFFGSSAIAPIDGTAARRYRAKSRPAVV